MKAELAVAIRALAVRLRILRPQQLQGDPFALELLVDDGKAVQVPVTPGIYTDGLVEIAGNVAAGASVVTQGNERLLPGQAVRVLK